MLSNNNLKVDVAGKSILHGINLDVKAGEVHAIMGPNASGKSTLAHVLAEGRIVKSGDKTLAHELERHGYSWLKEQPSAHAV